MSMQWWMDKQIVLCPYNEILYSQKKKGSTNTYNGMYAPWKHCVKWMMSDTKEQILHGFIYLSFKYLYIF